MKYEVLRDRIGGWLAEAWTDDGRRHYVAIFRGLEAEKRAREYAAWKNGQTEMCQSAIAGRVPEDTARLDIVERECADVELTCGGVWRVTGVEGDFEADSLRGAIDKMMAALETKESPGKEVT